MGGTKLHTPLREPEITSDRIDRSWLQFWAADQSGGVALLFGLVLPVLAVTAVAAVEFTEVGAMKARLQANVDRAALAGARELATDRSDATALRAQVMAEKDSEAAKLRWSIDTSVSRSNDGLTLTVTQTGWRPSLFGNLIPPGGFSIVASATAASSPSAPLCVLGLQGMSTDVLYLQGAASMMARSCLVHSNSDVKLTGSSRIEASRIRTVGAANVTGGSSVKPSATTDSPILSDPFANLPMPSDGCNGTENITTGSVNVTIQPGVHCGTYKFGGTAKVTFAPGEHYFLQGSFEAGESSTVTGTDVVLFFKNQTNLVANGDTRLQFEGRKSGTYAGFLVITDRSYTGSMEISGQTARKLLGTLYLPNATLKVGGASNSLGADSAWTVVVAKKIEISGSVALTINSNYAGSSVPVPEGVGSKSGGGAIRLMR